MRLVGRIRTGFPYWRRRIRTIILRRRCYKCGLLGFYPYPDNAGMPLADLQELGVAARSRAEWELKVARKRGDMDREYDFRRGNSLGIAKWIRGGVKCGVSAPFAPRTTWTTRDAMPPDMYSRTIDSSAPVHLPGSDNPLYPDALAQTFIEQLVRPHDCRQFIKYRPGRAPREHPDERRQRIRTFWVVVAGLGGLATLAGLFLTFGNML